ncbi:MAG TPA: DUF6079 family protein, partial [Abditibacteriaceae bacterium]|nr:DUF6079 family protein [Abditibacteriaceae bacterium]
MLISDLIEVRAFPSVVQAADIRELRTPSDESAAVDDFIGGYLGFDERSRHALQTALSALAQTAQGGAFFCNGVFGSGKSHLLGVLTLLADGAGHSAFALTHPPLAPLLEAFAPRFVVHFSLDNYAAERFSLEEIFWREVGLEWARRGLAAQDLVLPESGARGEAFAALDEAFEVHGLRGLVVCMDELSLFLSAREYRSLQGDAAFLQFMGQRARRAPLWVFAALQKTMEDIGELEAYSLSQIRDRFTTLPLSLAHVPSLIEHRLIIRKDAAALHHVCHESFGAITRALPRLEFGRAEWESLYPFYPGTVTLLEQVVARFFSRTRSAVLFCAQTAGAFIASNSMAGRILPDALFDYIEPELEAHPDLRLLAAVWSNWRETVAESAGDEGDAGFLLRLMKGLLLFKIAGVSPTVAQLANAVALDAGLPGDGNYEYTRILLEKLRTRGSYLAVERHEGDFLDRYAIDLGTRVGEMARRFTRNTMDALPVGDSRIARYAAACCREEPLPLAAVETARSYTVMWRNAPRGLAVEVWNGAGSTQALANRVAMLAQPGQEEDALLLLVPPFSDATQSTATLQEAVRSMPDARWRAALILWTPRPPTHDEWDMAREATAQHLLESDPQLLDNRRGRAILQHLKDEAPQRAAVLSRISTRLLREGQIATGASLVVDAAELAGSEAWTATLEAIAEFALPHLFTKFESVAPRLRVLTASNCDQLCLDILRRPAHEPFFAPALERAVRAIAEPLGIARAAQGRWRIEALREDLAREIKELTGGPGAPLAAVEAHLAKSEWGLRPEQTAVALCALLRAGDLAAFDARGNILASAKIGMPLRRALHTLRPGQLLDAGLWARLQELMSTLGGERLGPLSFAEQEHARAVLAVWREEAVAETELAQARLHQLQRQLGHTAGQWPQTHSTWEEITNLLAALGREGGTAEVLQHAAVPDAAALRPALAQWRVIIGKLEERHAALLAVHALLTHPELAVPPDLQEVRGALLNRFDVGEAVLDDGKLLTEAEAWRVEYSAQYRAWHAAQHDAARWASYRRLAGSDVFRALEKLGTLTTRPFEQARVVRAALLEELAKGCARDGALRPAEATCAGCRLRWGERLKLRDPRELELLAEQGIAALGSTLQEGPVRDYLARQAAGRDLLEWDGAGETLLPLLSEETLAVLSEALRPRRCVTRTLSELAASFESCRTR